MVKSLGPDELLDLARAAITPTAADRVRIEQVLGARFDGLDVSPDSSLDATDGARGLDVSGQGGWLSGVGVKVGSAVVLVAAASAWWMAGSSTSPRIGEGARLAEAPAEVPAVALSPVHVAPTAVAQAPAREDEVPAVADDLGPETAPTLAQAGAQPVAAAHAASPREPLDEAQPSRGTQAARSQVPRTVRGARSAPTKHVGAAAASPGGSTRTGAPTKASAAPAEARADEPQAEEPSLEPSPRPDLLMAELSLIDEASRALSASRPAQALDALDRHRVLYGDGKLSVEREGLTALALCALGRVDAARSHAERFLRRHPSSPLVERVRAAADCEP